jgi:DNA-binding MarR family transcriptional regulator
MSDNSSVENIVNNIRRIFQAFNDFSKRANMEAGLTGPQLWAIKMVSEHGPLRVCDLAGRMFVRPGTVVGILDRLEAKGLVTRIRSRFDRREVMIELSAKGRDLVKDAPGVIQGDLVRGLETLPEDELRVIDASMARLVGILGAQQLKPVMIQGGGDRERPPES